MKDKVKIMFATFPYGGYPYAGQGAGGGVESCAVRNWLIQTIRKIDKDPRCELLHPFDCADTPTYMVRNRAAEAALKAGADLLVMIDNDMNPDLPELGARPFWDTSLDFWFSDLPGKPAQSPCVIAAPYCGSPPCCNVFVARWTNWANPEDIGPDARIVGLKLAQFTREDAAQRAGFERVAALPTGLMLLDTRVFGKLKEPYFDYEWESKAKTKKATTEDFYFSRNADWMGVPQYVNWDAWAGHYKLVCVGKPKVIYSEFIHDLYKEQAALDIGMDDRVMDLAINGTDALKEAIIESLPIQDRGRMLSDREVAQLFPHLAGIGASGCKAVDETVQEQGDK